MIDKHESERERLMKQRCQAEEIAKNYRAKQQEFYDQFNYKLEKHADKHQDTLDEHVRKAKDAEKTKKDLKEELRVARHRLSHLINENKDLTRRNTTLENKENG